MKIKIELGMRMDLYHKQTMQLLKIDTKVVKEHDSDSEAYKELCEHYRETIGYDREGNESKYDAEVAKLLSEDAKESLLGSVKTIMDVVKQCYREGYSGYIEFGGYVLNPEDFCAVRPYPIDVRITKN